jgi:hypothetical protein
VDAIVHQKLDQWLLMIRFERMEMMKGPKTTVYFGDLPIKNIPKRFDIDTGLLTAKAVRTLLVHWLQKTNRLFEAHEVQFQNGFYRDIAVLRAARFFGMERYTDSIMKHYVEYMRTKVPHYDEIAYAEAMRTSEKDLVWTAMLNHLTHLRYTSQIDDAAKFSKFLKKHPDYNVAMSRTDRYFKTRAAEKHLHRICNFVTGE